MEFSEMDESGGQAGKVGDIIEQKFRCFVHLLLIAALANLHTHTHTEERSHTQFSYIVVSWKGMGLS